MWVVKKCPRKETGLWVLLLLVGSLLPENLRHGLSRWLRGPGPTGSLLGSLQSCCLSLQGPGGASHRRFPARPLSPFYSIVHSTQHGSEPVLKGEMGALPSSSGANRAWRQGPAVSSGKAPCPGERTGMWLPVQEATGFWKAQQVLGKQHWFLEPRYSCDPLPACFQLGGCDGPHLLCLAGDRDSSQKVGKQSGRFLGKQSPRTQGPGQLCVLHV